ncbi:hypothetical protein DRQ09_04620, partial [candidate division KSB1 bacterium]
MRKNLLRRLLILGFVVIIGISFFAFSYIGVPTAEKGKYKLAKNAVIDNDTWIDRNNVRMVTTNRGSISWDIVTGNAGLEYPKGTGKLAVFAAGIWVYGMVGEELRTAVAEYGFEYFPGNITSQAGTTPVTFADGTEQRWQVLKLNKEDGPENPDYSLWKEMAQYGAPVDENGNPKLIGDQMLWTIFNDADPAKHTHGRMGQTRPLNIEVRESIFEFDKSGPLGNTVFIKLHFINKGPDTLTGFYASFWSDPDLGDAFNDLVGCDPELGLGYVYNADNNDGVYVGEGACCGYDFFQGIRDPEGNILPMTSFNKYINGTDPRTPWEAYYSAQGLKADGTPLIDPTTGAVTKFAMNGDPVTNSGWIDSAPADRRLMLSSGPTILKPGDENTIVVALVLGTGKERLGAISAVRYNDIFAQGAFDIGFQVPPDPPAPNVTVVPLENSFYISWQDNAESYEAAGYEFEGYNVYVTNKPAVTQKSGWKRVYTFDKVNGVQSIFGVTFDESTGLLLESPIQLGTDSGIKRWIKVTSDEWIGGAYPLIPQKEYYYAVTSYAYNPIGAPKALESTFNQLTIIPKAALPGTDYSGVDPGTPTEAEHTSGISTGKVYVNVVNPQIVTGQTYKVTFSDMGDGTVGWNLLAGNVTKISKNTNFSGDWNYPFVDGLIVRVSGITTAPSSGEVVPLPAAGDKLGFKAMLTDYANYYAGGGSELTPAMWGHDLEVRFTSTGSKASHFQGWGNWDSPLGLVDVPYEVWDIQADPPQQVCTQFYDRDKDDQYDVGNREYIAAIMRPYDTNTEYTWSDPLAG